MRVLNLNNMAQLFDPTKVTQEQMAGLVNVPGQSLATTNPNVDFSKYNTPTPVESITNPAPTPQVPNQTQPTDFASILRGVMASQPQIDTSGNDAIQAKINELSGSTDMTGYQDQLSQNYGVADKQKILAEKTAQLNTLNAESMARQENIRKQTLNQPGVMASIGQAQYSAQSNDEERTRAISALSLNAEIQAAQNNLSFATDQVDKMVSLKYKSIIDGISTWKDAYAMNRDSMSASEKRIGDAQAFAQQLYLNQINQQATQEKEIKTSLLDVMQKYPDAGVTLNDSIESANQKVTTKSNIYRNQIRLVGGGSGNGTTTPAPDTNIDSTTGKPLTAAQNTFKGYYDRTVEADKIITELGSNFTGVMSYITQYAPNAFKSEDRQRYEQAQRDFVNAVLRPESGAAISDSEFKSASKQYFPQPGDSSAVITQKATNRQTKINSLRLQAGQGTTTTNTVDLRAKYNY